jgi:hypothetical protein
MNTNELYEPERSSLRQELHNLKNCQITFLTTSVTATGLLLGLATTLTSKIEFGKTTVAIIFLLPLIVLLPFWWVFFDKATSITRIVGHYRILERLILGRCQATNFIGWENAIGEFRRRQVRGEFASRIGEDVSPWQSRLAKILLLRTGHRYWVISYYTFLALSVVCIVTSIILIRRGWYLVFPIVSLLPISISAWWNIREVWHLIYGHHSYDTNECYWEQVLEVEPKVWGD